MPKDNVLRTWAIIKQNGKQEHHLIDTIQQGENYILVLEWGSWPGVGRGTA